MLLLDDPRVGDQIAGIELNLDLVSGFAHFDSAANPGDRDGISVGVERDVALDIHYALVQPVDFRDPDRQRFKMHLLDGEQLARNGVNVFLVGRIDAITPLARLEIEILPGGECTSGKKVRLNEPEWPLDAGGAVCIASFMGHKSGTKTLGERSHLRHRNHLASGSSQHNHMGVVDH